MASPVLLVADDLSTIAAVKRVLAREGYEVVLATSAADAVIAWGHHLPGVVVLQPSVESDRGSVVLEELQAHPDAKLLRVVLLGETIAGFGYPVAPLPLDGEHFAELLADTMRASASQEAWQVIEAPPRTTAPAVGSIQAGETWRTAPANQTLGGDDVEAQAQTADLELEPQLRLEDQLLGDLHRDIEAEATASLEANLLQREQQDAELQDLEVEVRAEAARRRQAREARSLAREANPNETLLGDDETSFAFSESTPTPPPDVAPVSLAEAPTPSQQPAPPSTAGGSDVLSRAEAMLDEARVAAFSEREAESERDTALQTHLVAEHEARRSLEDEVAKVRDALERSQQQIELERTDSEARLSHQLEEAHRARAKVIEDLREQLDAERQMVDSLQQSLDEREAQLNEAQAQLDVSKELGVQLANELAPLRERFEGESRANQQLNAQVTEVVNELSRVSTELLALTHERDALKARTAEMAPVFERAKAELAALEEATQALAQSKARAGELAEHVVELESTLATYKSAAHESTNERDVLKGDLERLSTELTHAQESVARLGRDLATVREALDATSVRADTAEATLSMAAERIKELEHRSMMPLALPGRRPLGVPRQGELDLDALAKLVSQLVVAQADVRLELGVPGGARVLWFKKGQVAAAESSVPHETLVDRARRDGLIDARKETELRLVKHASAKEQLEAMRSRGVVRDIETVPLAQRFTEGLALEAFAEQASQYRLADDVPTSEVLMAAAPRATLPMLAEAIRRALPVDALLQRLGGGEAVCLPREADLDLRALGFGDRERKMLSWVDGATTVEDLAMASGLKQDQAYRALLVAKLLGAIEVSVPKERPAPPTGEVEVKRLDAKYDEVQDADYFTILGLGKTAGTDDVQRAFTRLSTEFDPFKYSGHPDPALQQRAQVVFSHLEEAAKALEDDRRRQEYARHLLD